MARGYHRPDRGREALDRGALPFADPFDRMIAGTALRLGVPLLTRDDAIVGSRRVRVVW